MAAPRADSGGLARRVSGASKCKKVTRDVSLTFRVVRACAREHADAPHAVGLLRARSKRPRSRRADGKRDEFASLHMPRKDHALYKHFATPMSALLG